MTHYTPQPQHQPGAPAAKPRRSTKVTVSMLVTGALLLILPIIAVGIAVAVIIPRVVDFVDDLTPVEPTAQVTIDDGQDLVLYAVDEGPVRVSASDCTVTSEDGPLEVRSRVTRTEVTANETTFEPFAQVPDPGAGTYTVTCDTTDNRVLAGPNLDLAGVFGTPAVIILVSAVAALIGIILLVIGFVRLLLSRGDRRKAMLQQQAQWHQHQQAAQWHQQTGHQQHREPPPPDQPRPPTHS